MFYTPVKTDEQPEHPSLSVRRGADSEQSIRRSHLRGHSHNQRSQRSKRSHIRHQLMDSLLFLFLPLPECDPMEGRREAHRRLPRRRSPRPSRPPSPRPFLHPPRVPLATRRTWMDPRTRLG